MQMSKKHGAGTLASNADLEASATPHGESVFGALPVQPNSNEHEMGAGENRGPAATADAWGLCAGGAGAVHRGQRVRAFRGLSGSIGPIPYVTFLRKSIHDVEFGRGPHSSFYSLFQDPEKHMDDMQRLRMFVRRYLVHTSEGNNPRQVPLYAFLSVRCAWPNVDRELVNRLVPEELAALVKADRGFAEEKERKRVREEPLAILRLTALH